MADKVIACYRQLLAEADSNGELLSLPNVDFQFSDSETCVRLEKAVNGNDVFLFQALLDPANHAAIDQNYMAFLVAARAFREWGANQITGILPYLAYARQDKPTRFEREPTTVKLMADLTSKAGIGRLVTYDPHGASVQGFYEPTTVYELDPLTLFKEAFHHFRGQQDVIVVAPDAGAAKLVTHFGRMMDLNSAIASKHRPKPEEAVISEIIGDFSGKKIAIVLDDMISSGGTVEEVIKKLVQEKGIQEIHLGVSHNLGLPEARERLLALHEQYGLQQLVVTNSIPQTEAFRQLPFCKIRDLSETFARVINRIHHNRPVSELFSM